MLMLAPALGGIWVHPVSHLAIAGLVLPIAAFALWRGYHEHGKRWILATGAAGMVLVLIGALWPFVFGSLHAHAATAAAGESACHDCCPSIAIDETTGAWSLRLPLASILTLLGGIGLVSAHLGNLRACAHCHT